MIPYAIGRTPHEPSTSALPKRLAKGALVPGSGGTRIGCANRSVNRARQLVSASDPLACARVTLETPAALENQIVVKAQFTFREGLDSLWRPQHASPGARTAGISRMTVDLARDETKEI